MSVYETLQKEFEEDRGQGQLQITPDRLGHFGSAFDPVPVFFDHTVAKFGSSFPGMYLDAAFKAKPRSEGERSEGSVEHSLLQHLPNREPISRTKQLFEALTKKSPDMPVKDMLPLIFSQFQDKKSSTPPLSAQQAVNTNLSRSNFTATYDQRGRNKIFRPNKLDLYEKQVREKGNGVDFALMRLLEDQTTRVTAKQFQEALLKSWHTFAMKNKTQARAEPFYLLLPNKYGSEHWLAVLLSREIARFPFKYILRIPENPEALRTFVLPPHNAHLVIVDDALYSGIHMTGVFDELNYSALQRLPTHPTFQLHFVVPFMTGAARELLTTTLRRKNTIYTNLSFYEVSHMRTIHDLVQCQQPKLQTIQVSDAQNSNVSFDYDACPTVYPKEESSFGDSDDDEEDTAAEVHVHTVK